MKIKLLLIITLSVFINTYAQIGFQDHIITDDSEKTNQPNSIFVDIDTDGDMDVLLSSYGKIGNIIKLLIHMRKLLTILMN